MNMKTPPVVCLGVLIILSLACSTLLGPKPTPAPPRTLHFENDSVAFDYPEGLKVFNAADAAFTPYPENIVGGQLVAAAADPHELDTRGRFLRAIGIFRHANATGSSLQQFMETAYLPVRNIKTAHIDWVDDSDGPLTLDGLPGAQQTYRYLVSSETPPYVMRDIWASKDDTIFRVAIWTAFHNQEDFAVFQSVADKVIGSLVVKDNLPALVETDTPEPTPSPTSFPSSMIAHFENEAVAFDYMKTLKVHAAGDPPFRAYPDFKLGGELVIGLGDPRFAGGAYISRSIRILRQQIPPGSNVEALMLGAYRSAEDHFPQVEGVLNANGPVTVDGLAGVQKTYRVYSGEPAYELRDIWIQRGDELFVIAIWTRYTNPDDCAAFEAGADLFLKSLHVK
jgi:hypothetical protein